MHKRHGAIVRQVLEEQLRLNAPKLIDRTLEGSSLLALTIGQDYLPAGGCPAGPIANQDSGERSDSTGPRDIILKKLDEIARTLGTGVGTGAQGRNVRTKPSLPTKRDTTLFAAMVRDLEGLRYCIFLDQHRVKPKWSEDGPKTYRESYLVGGSYPKKVQDEKTRAKQRMRKHPDSVLMDAFVTYLPSEFDQLSSDFNSRYSRNASKN
jgi:hypothetical protein